MTSAASGRPAWHHERVDADLTLAEAAQVLRPPMTEKQLIMVVAALNLPPSGVRHTGDPLGGRPRRTYPWDGDTGLAALLRALLPWLGSTVATEREGLLAYLAGDASPQT